MMEQFLARENLRTAWRRVKANAGAPGIDGIAVDCDLASFFDTVNHDRLMGQLREKIRDRKVLGLIRRYLDAGVVLPDGSPEATPQGVRPRAGRCRPCWPTSRSTPWTRNSNAVGIGLPAMPTTSSSWSRA